MTVFNYFPRKEDLFLDRQDDVKVLLHEALAEASKPIDALRRLVDKLHEQKHPFARIDAQTFAWWRVVAASPSLGARLRELGDEVVEVLAVELAGKETDSVARLVAGMIVVTWRTAYAEGLRVIERGGSAKKANAAFLELMRRGFRAIRAVAK